MQLAGELQEKWVNYGGHYCRRHKGLESMGIEVWEGTAGVMTLEESGSTISIGTLR